MKTKKTSPVSNSSSIERLFIEEKTWLGNVPIDIHRIGSISVIRSSDQWHPARSEPDWLTDLREKDFSHREMWRAVNWGRVQIWSITLWNSFSSKRKNEQSTNFKWRRPWKSPKKSCVIVWSAPNRRADWKGLSSSSDSRRETSWFWTNGK